VIEAGEAEPHRNPVRAPADLTIQADPERLENQEDSPSEDLNQAPRDHHRVKRPAVRVDPSQAAEESSQQEDGAHEPGPELEPFSLPMGNFYPRGEA